jgi:hypothetical protein
MNDPVHILSLGAGVQSSTLALMASRGEVAPMPAAAVFADTHAEPQSVYRWLDWLEKQLAFPLYRVSAGSLTEATLAVKTNAKTGIDYLSLFIPAYIRNPDGSKGIVGRHCTANYKIVPLRKKARELGGIRHGQKTAGVIEWIGISLDEIYRARPSPEAWTQRRWPLIEMEMSRHDCLRWMQTHGYPAPPRSACIYCPFHSDHEWRRLRDEEPAEFAAACKFEREMQRLHTSTARKGKCSGVPFLHASLTPLPEVDFSTPEERGQLSLQWAGECEGMCGV